MEKFKEVAKNEFYRFIDEHTKEDLVLSSIGKYPYATHWKTRRGNKLKAKSINFHPKEKAYPIQTKYYILTLETTEKIKLKFVGIDNWNRPIWKVPNKKEFYGDVDNLFSKEVTKEEVMKTVSIYDLCFFGDHFGCEPMGNNVPDKYYI